MNDAPVNEQNGFSVKLVIYQANVTAEQCSHRSLRMHFKSEIETSKDLTESIELHSLQRARDFSLECSQSRSFDTNELCGNFIQLKSRQSQSSTDHISLESLRDVISENDIPNEAAFLSNFFGFEGILRAQRVCSRKLFRTQKNSRRFFRYN